MRSDKRLKLETTAFEFISSIHLINPFQALGLRLSVFSSQWPFFGKAYFYLFFLQFSKQGINKLQSRIKARTGNLKALQNKQKNILKEELLVASKDTLSKIVVICMVKFTYKSVHVWWWIASNVWDTKIH